MGEKETCQYIACIKNKNIILYIVHYNYMQCILNSNLTNKRSTISKKVKSSIMHSCNENTKI